MATVELLEIRIFYTVILYSSEHLMKSFRREVLLAFFLAVVFAVTGFATPVSANSYPNQYGCYPYCNSNTYTCQSNSGAPSTCSGYLYQDPNGCVELAIPVYSPYGILSFQYYTLQGLPASHPAIGAWVTVTGQVYLGPNQGPNGVACPGNYITVSSIS